MRDRPLDMETYLNARVIGYPLHLYDCCLETDGALACIVTSVERARDLRRKPALVHSVAQASGPNPVHLANFNNTPSMETTSVFCAKLLWERSALGPNDMGCAQIYDAFTPLVVTGLEDYGFLKRGEGVRTPRADASARRRDAVLTSGGGLSEAYVHGFKPDPRGSAADLADVDHQVPDLQGDARDRRLGRSHHPPRCAARDDGHPSRLPLPDVDDPICSVLGGRARRQARAQREKASGRAFPGRRSRVLEGRRQLSGSSDRRGDDLLVSGRLRAFSAQRSRICSPTSWCCRARGGPRLVGYMVDTRPRGDAFGMKVRSFRGAYGTVTFPSGGPTAESPAAAEEVEGSRLVARVHRPQARVMVCMTWRRSRRLLDEEQEAVRSTGRARSVTTTAVALRGSLSMIAISPITPPAADRFERLHHPTRMSTVPSAPLHRSYRVPGFEHDGTRRASPASLAFLKSQKKSLIGLPYARRVKSE